MSILRSIEEAKKRGATADQIVAEIERQNPQKAQTFKIARERGANAEAMLREIEGQNFLKGIAQKESGGRYNALGPVISKGAYEGDRAYGKYQIMGKNIPSWTKQYLGRAYTPQEFVRDQAAQDKLMRARAEELHAKYGNWDDVASVHFTGRPAKQGDKAKDQLGTSGEQYRMDVVGRLREKFDERTQKVGESKQRYADHEQSLLSTVFQGAGQLAGAGGDILAEALSVADHFISGGKASEALGSVMQRGLESPLGKQMAERNVAFKQEHPVATANTEAAVNIASLLPVGKGLQAVGGTTAKAASVASRAVMAPAAERAVSTLGNRYADIFQSTKPLKNTYDFITSKGSSPERVLSERKIILGVDNGKIDATDAIATLEKEVAERSTVLDKALAKYPHTVPADTIKTQIKKEIAASPEIRAQGRVRELQGQADKIIDDYVEQSSSDAFKLSDIQAFKKGQYELSKKFKISDVGRADAHSEVASAFRRVIEQNADDVSVRDLNRQVGELEDTINILNRAQATAIRGGRLGRYAGRIVGATAGSQTGLPLIGPVLGAMFGDALAVALQKTAISGPLNRILIRMSHAAPDNTLIQKTIDFIEAVERGEVVLPDDEVIELLAQISVRSDIPLLPAPAQHAFKSIILRSKQIDLPEKAQSTIDAVERANPNIKSL